MSCSRGSAESDELGRGTDGALVQHHKQRNRGRLFPRARTPSDSDCERPAHAKQASKIDVEGAEITDAVEFKRHETAKAVAQHVEEPLGRARRTRNLLTASEDDLLVMLQVPAPSTGTDAATADTPNLPANPSATKEVKMPEPSH
ncbi:hypothetical protein AK812_SmicGene27306 [Symbiodinium microadriaticum]|uniref:Uncharacterized protein n=1 Tax=Symbiodinium microadriaticum TaxID=2951 RepID=A0A1Q9D7A0_SYMMI|nr:hypothetical protein AK812_SmicGene27306 [Symbiodinium microadriaticum]